MKKKLQKPVLLFIIILTLSGMATRKVFENDFITMLKEKLEVYLHQLPHEKIYLQFDKPFYFPGDDIWYSSYLIDMKTSKLSRISEIVYVELIDPKGSVIKTNTIYAKNGLSNGEFTINRDDAGGIYKVKAYTNHMKNFGDTYVFEKEIQIQKAVLPKLLMKLEFEKEAYGSGDRVKAKVKLSTTENQNMANQEFSFVSQIAGEEGKVYHAVTDEDGNATIEFDLSEDIKSTDGILNVMVDYNGTTESVSGSVPITLNKIDLRFFPEGGDLIRNVKTRVAFEAKNEYKKAADIEGYVEDQKGTVVTRFESYKNGMGAFDFLPEENKRYRIKITRPKGIDSVYLLPDILPKGFVLNVDKQVTKGINLRIVSPFDNQISIVAQMSGQILYSGSMNTVQGENEMFIPTEKMPAGILKITLFDQKNIERCERLVFVNKYKQLNISVSCDKEKYMPREKVKMTIRTTDENGLAIPANLSLSVVDEKLISYADDKQDNILSYLLMSSDLKGKIQDPDFYFDKNEPKADTALDFVMMTHGWRHFVWDDVLNWDAQKMKETVQFPVEKCIITGKVVNYKTDKPAAHIKVKISGGINPVLTDAAGMFEFTGIDPYEYYTLDVDEGFTYKDVKFMNKCIPSGQYYTNDILVNNNIKPIYGFAGGIINGTVTDENGEAMPGVTVLVKGTSVATITMLDGSYSLNVPANSQYLVYKYIGYQDMEMPINGNNINITLSNTTEFEEVIVTAVGISKKSKALGYSVSYIEGDDIFNNSSSVINALQGRVAGLTITNSSGVPGSSAYITLRGAANYSGYRQPLFIIDGFPVDMNNQDRWTFGNSYNPALNLNPQDIETIEVIKGINGTAMYGSKAVNGVIVITTKKGVQDHYYRDYYYDNNYCSVGPSKRKAARLLMIKASRCIAFRNDLYRVREFYSPDYENAQQPEVRNDFRTTVYWKPDIVTDNKGKAEITFYNTDEVSSFKTVVEGIASDGCIGRSEHLYYTQLPFSLDAKLPAYFSFDDRVNVPITLMNKSDHSISGIVRLENNAYLELIDEIDSLQSLLPGETKTIFAAFKVRRIQGESVLNIGFSGSGLSDVFESKFEVKPKGFPITQTLSGNQNVSVFKFTINDLVENSLTCNFTAYPNILDELLSGTESMLRQPSGCFEQVSSTNYPNIVALKYMRETGQINPDIEQKAKNYLIDGYKRLAAYETSSHGFDWYGQAPGHEALSAYGLLQFYNIKDLIPDLVNQNMTDRTVKWLFDRKENDGNFKQHQGKYGFSGAKQDVANAYIVYALSETGYNEFTNELKLVYEECLESEDAYRTALTANTMLNLKMFDKAQKLLTLLNKQYDENGIGKFKAEQSVVCAYGSSLQIEVVSLYALALLKTVHPDVKILNDCINYILSQRNFCGFGSTQSTVLALNALTEYAKFSKHPKASGIVTVFINGSIAGFKKFDEATIGEIVLNDLEEYLVEGENIVKVVFSETDSALPFSVEAKWSTYTPESSEECRIKIETNIAKNKVKQGETVRLSTVLKNVYKESIPTPIAIIGIPSGLSINPKQIKELQEQGLFDYYEIKGNTLILYYKEFGPKEEKTINLDLKAEIPGTYLAPACSAYLYYTNEFIDWEAGETIIIE